MLQAKCTECGKFINSHLLAETRSIYCSNCQSFFYSEDLYIEVAGRKMLRQDVIDHMDLYESIVRDLEEEIAILKKRGEPSKESVKTLKEVTGLLRELLGGARNHFRLYLPAPLEGILRCGEKEHPMEILDISIVGARVALRDVSLAPVTDHPLELAFSLPGAEQELRVRSSLVWISDPKPGASEVTVGLDFLELSADATALLWKFLLPFRQVTDNYRLKQEGEAED